MVSETKKQLVAGLKNDISTYPVIGLVNMQNLPAQQLQKMRAMLRGKKVKIIMTRKNLIKLALEQSDKQNIKQLSENLKGMPALLFSKDNPFSLYAIIQKNKSEAPAKAGQEAPHDIIVKSGPTSFAPGPIISELAAVGIKTKVDAGKLAIIDDVTVAKEGDVISPKLAETLKRLDIKPMEIGLNLVSVWEKGTVFSSKELHIDELEYTQNFTEAAQWAMNLAVECAYPTADSIEVLLQKAFRETKTIAVEQNILTDETKEDILAKVEAQALAVKEAGKIEAQVEPKGEKKIVEKKEEPEVKKEKVTEEEAPEEEKTVEEVKEEPKAEEQVKEETSEEEKVTEEEAAHEEEKTVEETEAKEEKAAEETKEEPEAKEVKVAEEVKEELSEEEIKAKMKKLPQEKIDLENVPEIDVMKEDDQSHPKQGEVSIDKAEELFSKLQREGTLR